MYALQTDFFLLGMFLVLNPNFSRAVQSVEKINASTLISKVSQEQGKVVVLNFWASWCPACQEEIRGLKELREVFASQDLKIIGVAMDKSNTKIKEYAREKNIYYTLYQGSRNVAYSFNLRGVPTTIVYDAQGNVEKSSTGFLSLERLKTIVKKLLSSKN